MSDHISRDKLATATDLGDLAHTLLTELRAIGHAQISAAARRHISNVAQDVHDRLKASQDSLLITPATRRLLTDVIDLHPKCNWETARGLALGIDSAFGHRFYELLIGRRTVAPGDPIPLSRPNPSAIVRAPTVNPTTLESNQLDVLPHLRLAPRGVENMRVILEVVDPESLVANEGPRRIAVVQPAALLSDFEWDLVDEDAFFNVRLPGAEELIRRLVSQALDVDPDVLIIPELCVSETLAEELHSAASNHDHPPFITVPGSHHFTDGTIRENRSLTLFGTDGARTLVTKFHPFEWAESGDRKRTEDLTGSDKPTITIRSLGNWSVATLICRDAIEQPFIEVLADLGVNLLCIPAFTAKTDPFETTGSLLMTRNQAFTVMACTPAEYGQDAVIVIPDRHRPTMRFGKDHADGGAGDPGLLIVDIPTSNIQWIPSE